MRSRIPTLELLVFVVGTSTLGAEIAAARLMAPFFGDSTIVWANTIAIVLVALSIGYWFGGRLADRHPHLRGLCLLVLAASLILGLVPIVANPFLSLSVDAFDSVSIGTFADGYAREQLHGPSGNASRSAQGKAPGGGCRHERDPPWTSRSIVCALARDQRSPSGITPALMLASCEDVNGGLASSGCSCHERNRWRM